MRRIAILAEGSFDRQGAKTAVGVLRYSQDTVVAVIDSTRAGQDAAVALGDPNGPGAACPSSPISPRHCLSARHPVHWYRAYWRQIARQPGALRSCRR